MSLKCRNNTSIVGAKGISLRILLYYFRDATFKLEAARSLTNEAIHIFQDKIVLTNNEEAKSNQWLENVSKKNVKIV